jgi:hypothetical protein
MEGRIIEYKKNCENVVLKNITTEKNNILAGFFSLLAG